LRPRATTRRARSAARLLSCLFRLRHRRGNRQAHATERARSGWPPQCQTCARGPRASYGTSDAGHPSGAALVSGGSHTAGEPPGHESRVRYPSCRFRLWFEGTSVLLEYQERWASPEARAQEKKMLDDDAAKYDKHWSRRPPLRLELRREE
jgi:hypothetical protein